MKRSLFHALPKLVLGIAPMVAMGLPAVMTAPASYAQESTDKAKEETKQAETVSEAKPEASQAESAKSEAKPQASQSESTKAGPGSEKSGSSARGSASASGSSNQQNGQSTSGAQSTRRQSNRAQSSSSENANRSEASGSASGDLQLNQPSGDEAAEGSASTRTRANAREGAADAQNRTGASARARTGASADSGDAAESTSRSRRSTDRATGTDQSDTADEARSSRNRTRDRSAGETEDSDNTDVRSRRDARNDRDMDRDDADNARDDRRDATRDRADRREDRRDDRSDRRFSQDRDTRIDARVNRRDRDVRTRFRSVNDFGLALSFGNNGLIVNDIYRTSVLRRYGFRQGDVIVSINGNPVRSQDDFVEYIVVDDVDRVPVVVLRDGQEETLYVVTEELYATDSGPDGRADYQTSGGAYLGVTLDRNYQQGARIAQVAPGSPAEEAGLERGDVITAINGRAIRSPNDVTRVVQQMQPGDAIEVELTHQVTDVTEVVLGQQRGRAAVRSTYEESYDDADVRYSRDRVGVEVTQPDVDANFDDSSRIDVEGRARVGGAVERDGDASGRARGGIRGIFRGGR